jgi:Fe2+ or Zn2+ uptake regulation protein
MSELDEPCKKILIFIVSWTSAHYKPINYTTILKELNQNGYKISRPTLSAHLKHLTEMKMLERTEISRSNVVYDIGKPNLDQHLQSKKDLEKVNKFFDDEESNFLTLNPESKVVYASVFSMLLSLKKLRSEVLELIDPKNKFEYRLEPLFFSATLERYIIMLLRDVQSKGKQYGEKIIEEIDKTYELYLEKALKLN